MRRDRDGIISIYVASPKVAKASKYWLLCVTVAEVIALTFANGNTAQRAAKDITNVNEPL